MITIGCLRRRRAGEMHEGLQFVVIIIIIVLLVMVGKTKYNTAASSAGLSVSLDDMRNLTMSIHNYRFDHGAVPFVGDPGGPTWGWATSLSVLTTPIPYSTHIPIDPYWASDAKAPTMPGHTHKPIATTSDMTFLYATAHLDGMTSSSIVVARHSMPSRHQFRLVSPGPDRSFENAGSKYGKKARFDPTNGMGSWGDITRRDLDPLWP